MSTQMGDDHSLSLPRLPNIMQDRMYDYHKNVVVILKIHSSRVDQIKR